MLPPCELRWRGLVAASQVNLSEQTRRSHRPNRIPERHRRESVDRGEIPIRQRPIRDKGLEIARDLSRMREAERIDDRGPSVPIQRFCPP